MLTARQSLLGAAICHSEDSSDSDSIAAPPYSPLSLTSYYSDINAEEDQMETENTCEQVSNNS